MSSRSSAIKAGLARRRAAGAKLGAPPSTTTADEQHVRALRKEGLSLREIVAHTGFSIAVVRRVLRG